MPAQAESSDVALLDLLRKHESLSVAQLPFDPTERWVGLAPLAKTQLPQSKLSIAMQSAVSTRMKILADLDVAETRVLHDLSLQRFGKCARTNFVDARPQLCLDSSGCFGQSPFRMFLSLRSSRSG